MNHIVWVFCIIVFGYTPILATTLCTHITKEINEFRRISPAGVQPYRQALLDCEVTGINGLPLDDYFQTESDVLLGYIYLSFITKETHEVLLDYMIKNERWDLLLQTLDMTRKMKKSVQLSVLNYLYYKPLPDYFQIELKEMFNFFTAAEKIAFSQQLIPNTSDKMVFLNRKKNYIYEFWPMFDQMAFIFHLRVMYPYQFEQLTVFWREKLVSFYYSDVEQQDSSFIVLSRLLNLDKNPEDIPNANGSLKAYYYLKTNQRELAEQLIKSDKQRFFDMLRYFDFMTPSEKAWALSQPIQITLSDIEVLFLNYYFQIENSDFRAWVWQTAVDQKFDLDQYFKRPETLLATLPQELRPKLNVLSPKTDYIQKMSGALTHFYNNDPVDTVNLNQINKESLSELVRFYSDYKAIPYKRSRKVLKEILPYISVDTSREFLRLKDHLSMTDQLYLVGKFDYLTTMPTENRTVWNRWLHGQLSSASQPKY